MTWRHYMMDAIRSRNVKPWGRFLPFNQKLTGEQKARPDDIISKYDPHSISNGNRISIAFAPLIHRPGTFENIETTAEAHLHATLACRLFTSRIAHHVLAFQQTLSPGSSAQQIQVDLSRWMESALKQGGHHLPPESITVVISDHPGRSDQYNVTMRLRAPASILGIGLGIRMEFETSFK